jgi:glutaconate CoA-transferase subunit B
MTDNTTDYTVDEIMCAALAAKYRDGDEVCNGMASFIPVAAIMLARMTTAPGLVWLAAAAGVDPRPERVPASTLEAPLWRDSVMYVDQYSDFWHYAQNGRNLQIFCVGAAQLDMYGNANNSVIGSDYHAPKVRLPGTAGLGDMGSLGKRLFYWNPNHSPRALVERVDFRSAAGFLDGGDQRESLGLTGGPEIVVTNLAVLDFEPNSKRMRLKSVHPGQTVEGVQDATGFELVIPDGPVPETLPPDPEQIRLLREVIDPDGHCKREAGVRPSSRGKRSSPS